MSGATHEEILEAVKAVRTEIDGLKTEIGFVDFDIHGTPVGKGMAFRVLRLETRVDAKFNWIDTLLKQAMTAVAVLAVAGGVIWWLVQGDMDRLFRQPPAVEAVSK